MTEKRNSDQNQTCFDGACLTAGVPSGSIGVDYPCTAENRRQQLRDNPPEDLHHIVRVLERKGFCADDDHSFSRPQFNECQDVITALLRARGCHLDLDYAILRPNWDLIIYDKGRFPTQAAVERVVQAQKEGGL